MSSKIFSLTVAESPLSIKLGFLRRYFALLAVQLIIVSSVANSVMLSPIARFYITENDWLLIIFGLLFFVSYLIILRLIELPAIKKYIFIHVIIEAATVAITVTFYDFMFLLQGITLCSCIVVAFYIYTLQSYWNFNIWTILCISIICIVPGSTALNAMYGGTHEENVWSIFITVLLLVYYTYVTFKIIHILSPVDYILAVANVQFIPHYVNVQGTNYYNNSELRARSIHVLSPLESSPTNNAKVYVWVCKHSSYYKNDLIELKFCTEIIC